MGHQYFVRNGYICLDCEFEEDDIELLNSILKICENNCWELTLEGYDYPAFECHDTWGYDPHYIEDLTKMLQEINKLNLTLVEDREKFYMVGIPESGSYILASTIHGSVGNYTIQTKEINLINETFNNYTA